MTELQTPAQAAKHTVVNLGWYVAICLIFAVLYTAVDTRFFTKAPSWWQARQTVGYDFPAK